MDVDLKLNFRRRGARFKCVREAQALRIKLGGMNVLRVGNFISKVSFFDSGRRGRGLSPSQLAGEKTAGGDESGRTHVERCGTQW